MSPSASLLPLTRRADWPACLAAWFNRSRRIGFAWGLHDCCLWSASGICALTDVDLAAPLRGLYNTIEGARAAMLEHYGTADVWQIPAAHGLVAIPVAQARRGDLVGYPMRRRHSLGQCGGLKSAFLGRDRLIWVPTLECAKAWRVG